MAVSAKPHPDPHKEAVLGGGGVEGRGCTRCWCWCQCWKKREKTKKLKRTIFGFVLRHSFFMWLGRAAKTSCCSLTHTNKREREKRDARAAALLGYDGPGLKHGQDKRLRSPWPQAFLRERCTSPPFVASLLGQVKLPSNTRLLSPSIGTRFSLRSSEFAMANQQLMRQRTASVQRR